MNQEGEVKYCNVSKDIFLKYIEHNYNFIKEKLPLLESLDPDAIHDIRVTSRRNRALFAEYKHFLSKEIRKEYINENKKITKLLGKRRELDVLYQLITSIKQNTPKVLSNYTFDYLLTYI
ncbi:MAG: CHAD domain-containing protein, partial [Candidatus Hydrogenedens sp.]